MYKRILMGAIILVAGLSLFYWMITKPFACDSQVEMAALRFSPMSLGDGGHLVGIQPFLSPKDYACADRFRRKLAAYLDSVRSVGCLPESSIVVFPEYIGTWLVLMGEPAGAFHAQTLNGAMAWAVLRQPYAFWRAYQTAKREGWSDPAAVAAFRLKAQSMARAFHQTFAELARLYRIFIVAGSIVLPGAQIVKDSLEVNPEAPLENIAIFYKPDGRPDSRIVRKAFPIAMELGFTRPGAVQDLPTYETPMGRLGVLICADSWFPQSYKAIGEIDLLAVPSYLMKDSCWGLPWRGYSGWDSPPDVKRTSMTEGEAWLTYAMGGRLPAHDSAAIGLNIFLRGRFWDLGADGRAIVVAGAKAKSLDVDVVCIGLPKKS